MKKLAMFSVVALLVAAFAWACGGSDTDDEVSDLEREAVEKTGAGADFRAPVLRITEPKNGETVDDGDIKVKVDIDQFKIVDKRGQNAVPGEGHLVFYLDTPNPPTTPGRSASGGPGAVDSSDTSHTWKDVPAGNHTFAVQLVNNDGTPLNPPIVTGVTVVVK